jgi:hypothetical protein
MEWVRHHDRYDNVAVTRAAASDKSKVAACCD